MPGVATQTVPKGPVVMRQRWEDLLFLHWDVAPDSVQKTLPPGLEVDTWEGRAYIGFVPFFMRGVRPSFLPAVPWISDFLELNVRTYVRDARGRAGVWFYSLDCDQALAVRVARTFFHLPYFDAAMRARRAGGNVDYESRRAGDKGTALFRYQPSGPTHTALAGSIEEFLVERYRLFAARGDRLLTGCVWHEPYRIAPAAWEGTITPPLALAGFDPGTRPPVHAIYSPGVDVRIFAPSGA